MMKMKIELPATVPGRVMRGLVDVLQRQEWNVTVHAATYRSVLTSAVKIAGQNLP